MPLVDVAESELAKRLVAELEALARADTIGPPEQGSANSSTGVRRRDSGERALLLSASLLFGLREGWGELAATQFYRCGRSWGQELALRIEAEARRRFSTPALEAPAAAVLGLFGQQLAREGWGRLQFDFQRGAAGLVEVRLESSACAESFGDLGAPGCHLYAGMLAGLLTVYARRELEAREIACRSAGADLCRFVVARPELLAPIELWSEGAMDAEEILARLSEPG